MSTPSATNGDCNGSKNEKTEKTTLSSDTIESGSASAGANGSSNSMKVQDFMSYLAKEANITNMTVETNDGRRISATFKHGLPNGTSTPPKGSPASNVDPSTDLQSAEKTAKGITNNETSEESSKPNGEVKKPAMMSPTRDIATTMAMMGAKSASTPSTQTSLRPEGLTSPEWAMHYQNKHVAVTYSSVVAGATSSMMNGKVQKTNGSSVSGGNTTTSLPPKKRAAPKPEEGTSESSWNAMSALVDAATVAQREHEQVPASATALAMGVNIPAASFKKKPTKRKPRKIIPEIKEYVEFTQKDVLFGRGGRSNHHPGNKTYRDIVTKQQNHYRGCDKNEKTKVAQGIVDHIQNVVGGRFLELDRDIKRWFLVPNVVARRKVGQALRENNTEEARAAKRAKYQGRLNNKKKSLGGAENGANGNGIVPVIAAPVVAVNGAGSNAVFPVGATQVATPNAFPIDNAETSNSVEV